MSGHVGDERLKMLTSEMISSGMRKNSLRPPALVSFFWTVLRFFLIGSYSGSDSSLSSSPSSSETPARRAPVAQVRESARAGAYVRVKSAQPTLSLAFELGGRRGGVRPVLVVLALARVAVHVDVLGLALRWLEARAKCTAGHDELEVVRVVGRAFGAPRQC